MNYSGHELLQSFLATCALPCFAIAPGYVAAWVLNVFSFRTRSLLERILWATALSLPLAIILSVHLGLPISLRATNSVFLVLMMTAAVLIILDVRRATEPLAWDRSVRIGLISAGIVILYVIAATAPIETRHGLYEPALWQDWNLRIQLVNECLRTAGHPANPMFALHGVAAPGRFYYYWYDLCAQIAVLTQTDGRAALTASCVAAAMAMMACTLLCVKHLGVSRYPLRKQGLAALLTLCVLGLDVLPLTLRLILPYKRFYPDPQFWLDDRSLAITHLVLWAPHHVAGLVSCVLGTMLVMRLDGQSWARQAGHAVLAGVAFAAAAGSSTFIAVIFALGWATLFVDALVRREFLTPRAMTIAAVVGVALSAPMLQSARSQKLESLPTNEIQKYENVLVKSGGARAADVSKIKSESQKPIKFAGRYVNEARTILRFVFQFRWVIHSKTPPSPGPVQRMFRPPTMVLLFLADWGFLLFVLLSRIRKDLPRLGDLDRNDRIWWLLLLTIAIPTFFITSAPIDSNNDLGRHAGTCCKFILTLWAAPMVAEYLDRRRTKTPAPAHGAWLERLAVATFVIGLLGQLWQIGVNRFDMQLTEAGVVPKNVVSERVPQIGRRFEQIRLAMDAAAQATTPMQLVQANPASRFVPVYLMYTHRRMAAVDEGCNTPFGGSILDCLPNTYALFELFGSSGRYFHGEQALFPLFTPLDPSKVTVENFRAVCHSQSLPIVVATYEDAAWNDRQSWVWHLQPIFANGTSHVFRCDAPVR